MAERLRDTLARWLRLPTEPPAFPNAGAPTRVFRAAPNYLRYRLAGWAAVQLAILLALLIATGVMVATGVRHPAAVIATVLQWAVFIVQLPLSYLVLRLDHELRWYLVSDRSLRIRQGALRLREQTIAFSNIQNLSIREGPLQRLLRIANLQIRTAGGGQGGSGQAGAGARNSHVVFLRGIDNASEIRELIRAHLRRAARGTEASSPTPPATAGPPAAAKAELLDAARVVLDEVRVLRRTRPAPSGRDAP